MKRSFQKNRRSPRREKGRGQNEGRWAVGVHAVREVFKVRPEAIAEFWVREGMPKSELEEWENLAAEWNLKVQKRAVKALDDKASGHQGVAVRVTENPEIDLEDLLRLPRACLMALDQVEDPQNLGAVLRTAWLMGVNAVAIARDHAVGLTPTVCKVASGGAEHVPLLSFGSWSAELDNFKKAGYWVFGLDEGGSKSIYQLDLPEKIIWVVGAEGKGLRKTTKSACDELIHIPQVPSGSSYNAATSAALCLGESHRQKGFWKIASDIMR